MNYNAKHDLDDVVGICGVSKKYHKDKLDGLNININSLRACEAIYLEYLEQNKGNKIKALIDYKGIEDKKNIYLAYQVVEKENIIKEMK